MSAVSSAIHEDLGVVTERLIPFAPRGKTREKLWELHEEYKEKAAKITPNFILGILYSVHRVHVKIWLSLMKG